MASGHGERLSRFEELAIACLLSERSIPRAARAARMDVDTLRRWLRDPAFQAAYRDARRMVVEQAVARLQQSTGKAAKVLHEALDAAKPGDRIRAANSILDHAIGAIELTDLLARIEALEAMQAEREQHHETNGRLPR